MANKNPAWNRDELILALDLYFTHGLVCADCHRMLHRGGELMTIEELRARVATQMAEKIG